MDDLHLKIALSMIPHMGPRLVRRLVAYAGGVEAVFKDQKKWMSKIPGIGKSKVSFFEKDKILKKAEEELERITKRNIKALFYLDDNYPLRLKECEDAPVILFVKGDIDLNAEHVLSIVGTRKTTNFGRKVTEEIVGYLASRFPDLLIVSGLAYGVDILAHRAALKNNLKTVAALGHGLDHVYPAVHSKDADIIAQHGALLSEFPSLKKADPGNFVSRNRIIAGLAEATIIVESAEKGGALITADLANSYNRDVFAVPGRSIDKYSRGCNQLIKSNKAALIENGSDIELALTWVALSEKSKRQPQQRSLFVNLSEEEKNILDYMSNSNTVLLDEICYSLALPIHKVSSTLLNLEFGGFVRSLPGKQYQKI